MAIQAVAITSQKKRAAEKAHFTIAALRQGHPTANLVKWNTSPTGRWFKCHPGRGTLMYVEDRILKDWLWLMSNAGIDNLTSREHEFLDCHAKYVQEFIIEGAEPNATWLKECRDHWVALYQIKRHENPFF
jgi:hypothetical protein